MFSLYSSRVFLFHLEFLVTSNRNWFDLLGAEKVHLSRELKNSWEDEKRLEQWAGPWWAEAWENSLMLCLQGPWPVHIPHNLDCMPCHNFQGPGKQGMSQLLCWEIWLWLSMACDMGIPLKMERASQIGQPKIRRVCYISTWHVPRVEHSEFLLPLTFCHSYFDSPQHLGTWPLHIFGPRQLKATGGSKHNWSKSLLSIPSKPN